MRFKIERYYVDTAKSYWDIARRLGGETLLQRVWLFLQLLRVPLQKKILGQRPIPLVFRIYGTQLRFFVRDAADIAVLHEVFCREEYAVVLSAEPRRIIDIGSHIGVSVLFFATRYPQAAITAYEPDPQNAALLRKNLQPFENISCIEAAVSSRSGTSAFFVNESSISSSMIPRGGTQQEITVNTISLREILEHESVDLLKFDAEGAEFDMFEDAPLANCRALVGEVHYALKEKDLSEFLALLPDFSYREKSTQEGKAMLFLYK